MTIVRHSEINETPDGRLYREPMIIKCSCGSRLELWSSWANPCDRCHREWNSDGSELAPRSQWGEETGETQADFIGL